jgi:rod shape-determining protein MreC
MRARKHHRLKIWPLLGYTSLVAVATGLGWFLKPGIQVAALVHPVTSVLQDGQKRWLAVQDTFRSQRRLLEENSRLKEHVGLLERQLNARDEAVLENVRLKDLLRLRVPEASWVPAVAPVVGRAPDNWHQRVLVTLNPKLTWRAPATAIARTGVVGRLTALSGQTGVVVLVTDPGSALPVVNARTRSTAIMTGQDDAWPSLKYMMDPDRWRVGDRIVTSGLSGVDPKGILVGHVIQLKRVAHSLYPELRVQPVVKLDTLEEVVILPKGMRALPMPKPSPTPQATPTPAAAPASGGIPPRNPKAASSKPITAGSRPPATKPGASPTSRPSAGPTVAPSAAPVLVPSVVPSEVEAPQGAT